MILPLPGITATKPGSATQPFPGVAADVVDEREGKPVDGQGLLVLTRPWPAMLRTLYKEEDRFVETYFSRFGQTYQMVAEAAVIGQSDDDTGQAICAFVTLQGESEGSEQLVEDIRGHVADRIGKFARPKRIIWADDLPKTRSGKIMRRLLRDIAEGRALGHVTTLRDPDVMAQLEGKIKEEQAAEE